MLVSNTSFTLREEVTQEENLILCKMGSLNFSLRSKNDIQINLIKSHFFNYSKKKLKYKFHHNLLLIEVSYFLNLAFRVLDLMSENFLLISLEVRNLGDGRNFNNFL